MSAPFDKKLDCISARSSLTRKRVTTGKPSTSIKKFAIWFCDRGGVCVLWTKRPCRPGLVDESSRCTEADLAPDVFEQVTTKVGPVRSGVRWLAFWVFIATSFRRLCGLASDGRTG